VPWGEYHRDTYADHASLERSSAVSSGGDLVSDNGSLGKRSNDGPGGDISGNDARLDRHSDDSPGSLTTIIAKFEKPCVFQSPFGECGQFLGSGVVLGPDEL